MCDFVFPPIGSQASSTVINHASLIPFVLPPSLLPSIHPSIVPQTNPCLCVDLSIERRIMCLTINVSTKTHTVTHQSG